MLYSTYVCVRTTKGYDQRPRLAVTIPSPFVDNDNNVINLWMNDVDHKRWSDRLGVDDGVQLGIERRPERDEGGQDTNAN